MATAANWRQLYPLVVCVILLFGNLASKTSTHAQELTELRNSVSANHNNSNQTQSGIGENSRNHCKSSLNLSMGFDDEDNKEEDTTLTDLIGGVFLFGASSPFWAPRAAIGDDSMETGYFLRYPYLHDFDGALSEIPRSPAISKMWMMRVRGEYADNFDDLSKIGGAVLLDTASRWGLDTELNYRQEDLFSGRESLWTGNSNVVFRFAQSEKLQMRTGIGVNWLADHGKENFGFNFTYSGDWFPAQPIVVSHEIDWGRLGNASLFHGRITTGVIYHRMEVYVGYDYYHVGSSEISGMVAGVRLWLTNRRRR